MRLFRRLLLLSSAMLALGAPAALADDPGDPHLAVKASLPYTWWGSSVTVKITATQPGWVSLAQSRRYVVLTPGGGACGWDDKYLTDLYGVHGDYLLGQNGPEDLISVGPGQPATVRLTGASLQFGAGDWPWANTETWPGCKTKWTPYNRLSVYFAPHGTAGGSYYAYAEKHVPLTRLF